MAEKLLFDFMYFFGNAQSLENIDIDAIKLGILPTGSLTMAFFAIDKKVAITTVETKIKEKIAVAKYRTLQKHIDTVFLASLLNCNGELLKNFIEYPKTYYLPPTLDPKYRRALPN